MQLDFGSTPHKLHEEYLDVYEGIQCKIVYTTRFDENSDLSMTYLGRSDKARNDKLKAEECQLFRTNLQYMGNEIFIQNKRVCVQPLRSRLEVIQKLQPPSTVKGCRSFVGMVNFLSMFCPELQKLLKPIYDFTRKRRSFIWEKEQQDYF